MIEKMDLNVMFVMHLPSVTSNSWKSILNYNWIVLVKDLVFKDD